MIAPIAAVGPRQRPSLDFGALVESEQGRLLRLSRRLVHDPEEARDLVQSALADAWSRRGELRDVATAAHWLRRILVRRALRVLRRRRLWLAVRDLLDLAPSPVPAPDATLEVSRDARALAEALRRLPVQQATAFTLRYLEGLSIDEVAKCLVVTRGTVRTHLGRALRKLRARGLLAGEAP